MSQRVSLPQQRAAMIDKELSRLCGQGKIAGWSKLGDGVLRYRQWIVETNQGNTLELRATAAWAFIQGFYTDEEATS